MVQANTATIYSTFHKQMNIIKFKLQENLLDMSAMVKLHKS